MSLTVEYANTPVWTNEAHTAITLNVKFVQFDEVVPFVATPTDDTTYGPVLFANAEKGDYGPIAPYVAPPVIISTMPTSLPPATEGSVYITQLSSMGGTAPYAYAVAEGNSLPEGLRVQDDVIVGTLSYNSAGNYSFVITTTDANGDTGNATITVSIYDATPPGIA